MRFTNTILVSSLFAMTALASTPLKAIVVTYPEEVAENIIKSAEDAIVKAVSIFCISLLSSGG